MSAYAKLPAGDDEGERVVRESKVEEALGKAERIADRLGSGLGGGLRDASRALAAAGDVEGLIEDAELPGIEPDDALRTLARRLDREADLWRSLAFSELKNVRLTDRVLQLGGGAFAASTMILALFAGLGALLGASGGALLIGTGAGALAVGALLFVGVALVLRRNQRDTLRAALGRADLAELRLHRVAVAMAARAAEPERAGEILLRLERDARG